MGRFHQPDKYAPAVAAAADPVTEPVAASEPAASSPAPAPRSSFNRGPILEVDGNNPLAKLGFLATLVYMFGVYSLSEELSISMLGIKPYLTTITGIIAFMAAMLAGGFSNVLRFSASKLMIAFAVWMICTLPFSVWRGGSYETVSSYMTKSLVVMIFLLMTVTTWKQIRLVFYAMTAAALLLTVALRSSVAEMSGSDPRLAFSEGRLANPNDLATHMLMLMPFSVGMFFLSSRFSLLRPISALVTVGGLYTVLQTGSRGALITMVVLGLLLVWKMPSAVQRVSFLVGAFIFAAVLLPLLPSTVIQRYKLLLAGDETVPSNMVESQALESSESRRAILIRSIEMTFHHPIFGVGPGNFAIADADSAKQEGARGAWLQTHNSYTQVSSECGLIGLFFFAGTIFVCLRTASRYHKRLVRIPEFRGEALTFLVIFMSLTSFAINVCFSSLAYTFYVPSLVGVLGALVLVVDRDIAAYERRRRGDRPAVPASPFGPMFNPRRLNAN